MALSQDVARDRSVDLARGLACLLMVQTHAFHGWVAPAFQTDPGFMATRWLGAFPLPGFLILAGVSVALRMRPTLDRPALGRRALSVVGLGYATNLLWALLDGDLSWRRLLHADVLHAIGFSLLIVAVPIVPSQDARGVPRRLGMFAAWLSVGIAVASPFVTRATRDMEGPLRALVAPFSEVRGWTAMPVFPLAAWCALGVWLGLWLLDATDATTRQRRTTIVGAVGGLCLIGGHYATQAISHWLQEPLSRASVALWPNLIEGAGRGLVLLWIGTWLARRLPIGSQRLLARYGSASLWIYVAHVPFCYGQLAAPLRAKLSPMTALPLVLLLIVACYGVVWVRDTVNARLLR